MNKIVIIPTYNERNTIEFLIKKILSYDFCILVIDDNSFDGTAEILEKLKKEINNDNFLEIIHRPKKLGLGTAYKEGFRYVLNNKKYNFIFMMDGDFSHNPDYLPVFVKNLEKYDLIIGSRYVVGGNIIGWSFYRKCLSFFGNLYAKTLINIPIKDFTSGFMGFGSYVLQNIDYNNIKSEGYGFLIELKYRIYKKKYKICEIPIVFVDRISGKSKISQKIIFEAMILCIKLCLLQIKNKITELLKF